MKSKKPARQALPDLLKGVAVVLMIQVHLTELFAVSEFSENLAGRISLFLGGVPAAPLFMAVMGWFVGASQAGFGRQTLRGLKLIGWGFLLNIGMNLHLFLRIFNGTSAVDPLPYLFGVDILFLAGLSVIIVAALRLLLKNRIAAWLAVAVIAAAAGKYLPSFEGGQPWLVYLFSYFYGLSWWSYFPVLPWLAYPVFGFVFFLIYEEFNLSLVSMKLKLKLAAVLLVIILITFKYGFSVVTDLEAFYHHGIIFALWTIIFLLLLTLIFSLIASRAEDLLPLKYLKWVGKHVTSFYVIQWLIIGNTATLVYKSVQLPALILSFISITAATSLLVWLWSKRSAFRYLG